MAFGVGHGVVDGVGVVFSHVGVGDLVVEFFVGEGSVFAFAPSGVFDAVDGDGPVFADDACLDGQVVGALGGVFDFGCEVLVAESAVVVGVGAGAF